MVGLDVSQAETAVCVIDETGQTRWEGTCRSTSEAIGRLLRQRAPEAVTIAMETGPLAVWHWHALRDAGFPVVCLHARHAQAALSLQLNKTDRNDAAGRAQLVRMGGIGPSRSRAWRAIPSVFYYACVPNSLRRARLSRTKFADCSKPLVWCWHLGAVNVLNNS